MTSSTMAFTTSSTMVLSRVGFTGVMPVRMAKVAMPQMTPATTRTKPVTPENRRSLSKRRLWERSFMQPGLRNLLQEINSKCGLFATVGGGQVRPRITLTWRSLSLTRSVLRLIPRSSAARSWFPEVAASTARSSGGSTSARMRS
jgi:hypothetical protein